MGYGDINSPYGNLGDLSNINKNYDSLSNNLNTPKPPGASDIDTTMDDEYYSEESQDATSGGGGEFSSLLGEGVDIYDPQSIAASLGEKYGIDGLTAGMFPAMSKDLMASTQASTYDAYKNMLADPARREFRKEVSSSAGILNPNKKRQRALRMFESNMGDINENIFSKTSMARSGVREWLSNALGKVKRMRY